MNLRLAAQLTHLAQLIPGAQLAQEFPPQTHAAPSPTPRLEAPSWPAHRPKDPPPPRVLVTFTPAAELVQDIKLSKGAARLWSLLHRLAQDVARHRAYAAVPSAVTFHLPACAVALFLGYTERHTYRLAAELHAVGLLDYGGHAQRVGLRNLWDGSLWKVATVPAHIPRIRADEWKHQWRPGFGADYHGKTGAAREMSGLQTQQADMDDQYHALKRRAAVPDGVSPPAVSSPDNSGRADLGSISEALPDLLTAHPTRRAALVGTLASAISQALNEPHRRRQWAGTIYAALRAENEQRSGIPVLELALLRMAADLREGAPWRKPGAILTARLN